MYWNKDDTLIYHYSNGIQIENKPPFSQEVIKLTAKWDTVNIQEKGKGRMLDSNFPIHASRVLFNNGKCIKVNCLKFYDF